MRIAHSACTFLAAVPANWSADFYGTTYYGGAYGPGTVFKITAVGTLTTL